MAPERLSQQTSRSTAPPDASGASAPSSQEKVRIPKGSELIADALRRQIVRGVLKEGTSLPSERELMAEFGVSRPTLREAFRILESEQFVSIARGARGGARVRIPDVSVGANYVGLLLQARDTTVADVYDVRRLTEPPMTRMCVENCSDEHLAVMRECLRLEEECIDSPLFARYASRFHHLLAKGSGNSTLEVITSLLLMIIENHISAAISAKRSHAERLADNRKAVRSHQKLLKIMEARDGEAAQEHWRKFMDEAGEIMLRALGPTAVIDLFAPSQSVPDDSSG